MKYILRFSPEVEADIFTAYAWYEGRARGLGEEFLRVFYSTVFSVRANPRLSPEIDRGFRRRLLRRFPYGLYYKAEGKEVIVFGVFHCARDPRDIREEISGRWERRLK
jgi:toxin ParE1/3/4